MAIMTVRSESSSIPRPFTYWYHKFCPTYITGPLIKSSHGYTTRYSLPAVSEWYCKPGAGVTSMTSVPLYSASVRTARNCAEAGYRGCCVKNNDEHTCWVHGGKCFCDAECYTEGRCCHDIKAVGCSTG